MNGLIMLPQMVMYMWQVWILKMKNIWNIREKAGMVFQNPDNQIVATIVEEDVAFGQKTW